MGGFNCRHLKALLVKEFVQAILHFIQCDPQHMQGWFVCSDLNAGHAQYRYMYIPLDLFFGNAEWGRRVQHWEAFPAPEQEGTLHACMQEECVMKELIFYHITQYPICKTESLIYIKECLKEHTVIDLCHKSSVCTRDEFCATIPPTNSKEANANMLSDKVRKKG